jgi:hypothetical protein
MLGVLCVTAPAAAQTPAEKALERTWLDADRKPLPFRTDHTRAFQAVSELLEPEKIVRVNRAMWERLSKLTEEDLRRAVSDCLEGPEIHSLMVRRKLLLEHVEKLVDRRGEKLVFY